jgi:hypothetical protein
MVAILKIAVFVAMAVASLVCWATALSRDSSDLAVWSGNLFVGAFTFGLATLTSP